MSPMVTRNTGAPRTTPIQNRRVMSASSGFGASLTSGTRGSSAIPHFGHVPGPSCTTSGCIGHVYSIGFASRVLGGFASRVLGGFASRVLGGFASRVLGGFASRVLGGFASRVLGGF